MRACQCPGSGCRTVTEAATEVRVLQLCGLSRQKRPGPGRGPPSLRVVGRFRVCSPANLKSPEAPNPPGGLAAGRSGFRAARPSPQNAAPFCRLCWHLGRIDGPRPI